MMHILQILIGLPLYLETWKYLEFDNLGQKNLEFLTIFTCLVVKFCFNTKNLSYR